MSQEFIDAQVGILQRPLKAAGADVNLASRESMQPPRNGRVFIRLHPRKSAFLNQPIARDRHRVLPVMTPTTLPVVLRRLRNYQRDLNSISQTY